MKKYSPSLKKIASITGLFLGFFALSVWAADWTPAPDVAPKRNTDAPINVGSTDQNKLGGIAVATSTNKMNPDYSFESGGQGFIWSDLGVVGKTITGALMVKGTDSDKAGYVLTNDGNGNAEWKITGAGGTSGTGGTNSSSVGVSGGMELVHTESVSGGTSGGAGCVFSFGDATCGEINTPVYFIGKKYNGINPYDYQKYLMCPSELPYKILISEDVVGCSGAYCSEGHRSYVCSDKISSYVDYNQYLSFLHQTGSR